MAEISKLNGYDLKDKQSRADIAGMKDGTIKVARAEVANIASNYIVRTGDRFESISGKFSEVEQTIQNVANGVNRGYSFDSIDKLIGDLEGQGGPAKYKIGDELYIKSADKPDYWVAEVKTAPGDPVTGTIKDGDTVGYWVLYKLGEKTDLTLYQTKTDTAFNTTAKTVTGAVNEVKTKTDDAYSTARADSTRIMKMGYSEISPTDFSPTGASVILSEAFVLAAGKDGRGGNIAETYIKSLSVSGRTITYTKGDETTDTITTQDTTYAKATSTVLGLVKIGYASSGKNYAVALDSDGKMYVNIPWTDTVYTLPVATSTVRGGVKVGAVRSTAVTTNAASSTDGRYYMVERDSAEKLFVNIPWQNTTYGLATQSANGLMSAADKMKLDHIRISVTGEEMTITLS